jgi:hypothetical protein
MLTLFGFPRVLRHLSKMPFLPTAGQPLQQHVFSNISLYTWGNMLPNIFLLKKKGVGQYVGLHVGKAKQNTFFAWFRIINQLTNYFWLIAIDCGQQATRVNGLNFSVSMMNPLFLWSDDGLMHNIFPKNP